MTTPNLVLTINNTNTLLQITPSPALEFGQEIINIISVLSPISNILSVNNDTISLLSISEQGPAGPPGVSANISNISFSGLAIGQTIALPGSNNSFVMLILNGIVESPTEYTTDNEQITIPPGLAWDGAVCTVFYSIS
jgi:hypothetical protein